MIIQIRDLHCLLRLVFWTILKKHFCCLIVTNPLSRNECCAIKKPWSPSQFTRCFCAGIHRVRKLTFVGIDYWCYTLSEWMYSLTYQIERTNIIFHKQTIGGSVLMYVSFFFLSCFIWKSLHWLHKLSPHIHFCRCCPLILVLWRLCNQNNFLISSITEVSRIKLLSSQARMPKW